MLSSPFRFMLLLSLLAIQCSAPRTTAPTSTKPANSSDRLAKIKMTDLEGNPINLKDLAGKPVFLNFWATWCGPCVNEMPSIEKASKKFKDEIVFLAVSNEAPALIKSYIKKNKYSFKFGHLDVNYLDVYVTALPTTLLIDAKGQLVEEEEGFRNWMSPESQEKLESLVKK